MKLLMTGEAVGGVLSYALELAGALGARGIAIALALKGALSSEQWAQARRVPGLEIFESADRPEWTRGAGEDLARSSTWLLNLADLLSPDVIHLNDYAHGELPFGAPTVVVAHFCIYSWCEAVERPPPDGFSRYDRAVARGLSAAGLVISSSRSMVASLERRYGPLPRVKVIPHGRSSERFAPLEKEQMVLCAGTLPARNIAALDRAAAGLSWPVLLAGGGEHPIGSRRRPRARHARELGRLSPEALSCLYGRASIYVLPTCYEPFGLSILEAALAGCALVLGDIESLRETWDGAAFFIDPDSSAGISAALALLIERDDLRRTLGEAARGRALSFSSTRMADGYLAAYRELLHGREDLATSAHLP